MSLRQTLLTALASLGATLLILSAIWLFGPGTLRAAPAPQDADCGKIACLYVPSPTITPVGGYSARPYTMTITPYNGGYHPTTFIYFPMVLETLRIQETGVITGSVTALDVVGDRVYYNGDGALRIADISDPAAPVNVGAVSGDPQLIASISEIRARDSRLYTKSQAVYSSCCISTTLGLWDISQPNAVGQISALPAFHLSHIWVDGAHLYATSLPARSIPYPLLSTFGISDRAYVAVGTAGAWSGNSVVASGSYAYVSDRSKVSIFDVTDSDQPQLVGTIPVSNSVLALDDNRLYVVGDGGLSIWYVSNPFAPVKLGKLAGVLPAHDMTTVGGTLLYLAQGEAGISVINVGNPGAPQLLDSYDTPGTANIIRVSGDRIVVADGAGGLRILRAR